MPSRRRKLEVHRLTISGLTKPDQYQSFLLGLAQPNRPLRERVRRYGEKSHAIYSLSSAHARLRIRFLSFVTGHRPDILNTANYDLQPNPLSPAQTGVEWTHVLGGLVHGRFVLIVERVQGGISPGVLEDYIQWLVDQNARVPASKGIDRTQEPIVVSIEAEPGEKFLARLDALERITKATVRTVRPNPGFADLQTELADVANDSDAHKAEVTMTSRRGASLRRQRGILQAIRNLFRAGDLNYAAVEGERAGEKEAFNTSKLGQSRQTNLETDDKGQVSETDAWRKMSDFMDDLS